MDCAVVQRWPIAEASGRFGEPVKRAQTEWLQAIGGGGKNLAVLLSTTVYRKLKAARSDFRDYLLAGPKFDDFEVEWPRGRDREPAPPTSIL